MEKECLAIVLAVKAFSTYLLGKPFLLQTDNRALMWLQSFKDKNTRLTRWSLALQSYTFRVQHRKGRDNANADTLSRLPTNGELKHEEEELCFAQEKRSKNVTFIDNGPYANGLENGRDDFMVRLRSDQTSLANQEQGLMEVLIDHWKAM